jgi:hypothetical protein
MKHLLSFCLLFLIFTNLALASSDAGIKNYLIRAKTVYLVRVTSLEDHKVTFSITETLRGEAQFALILTPESSFDFKINSEWILVSMPSGGRKDSVGGVMFGWNDWYPGSVSNEGGKITVNGIGTLDQTKKLLLDKPLKS